MGDPRQLRKKYSTPSHPWQKLRIDEEKILMKEYGFKNKTELWKLNSKLRNFKNQVKQLIPKDDALSQEQKKELLARLQKFSLVAPDAILEDILAITLKDMCERRLQTLVVRKGLARSMKQARQFITHEHVLVGDRKITAPSYIVSAEEQTVIRFASNSTLSNPDHPEVPSVAKEIQQEKERIGLVKPKKEEKEIVEQVEELAAKEIPSEGSKEVEPKQSQKQVNAKEVVQEASEVKDEAKESSKGEPKEDAPKEVAQ